MLSLMSLFRVLLQLNLAGNWLCGMDGRGEGTYTAEGIKALADAVAVNASLTNLNLESNDLVYGETGYVKANTVQGSSFNEGDKVIYQGREMIVSQGKDSDGDIYIKMKPVAPDLSGVKALADAILVNASLTQVLAFCQHHLTHASEHSLLRCIR